MHYFLTDLCYTSAHSKGLWFVILFRGLIMKKQRFHAILMP